MTDARMRPRFATQLPHAPQRAYELLAQRLEQPHCPFHGNLLPQQIELKVPAPQHHFWSPQLVLVFRDAPDGAHALLEGRFGPGPEVWTLFMASYAALTFSGAAMLILASSQWTVGQSPWGAWVALACALGLAITYAVALIGRTLGTPQMRELRAFVDQTLALTPQEDSSNQPLDNVAQMQ
jgi:hypothetical protein